jgi:3-hydroxyacyl-CoA dehydrogenase
MNSQEAVTGFSQNAKSASSTSPEDVTRIKRVFVVGAGTMGTQIALQCASHGCSVLLYDDLRPVLDQAPARLELGAVKAIVFGSMYVRQALYERLARAEAE